MSDLFRLELCYLGNKMKSRECLLVCLLSTVEKKQVVLTKEEERVGLHHREASDECSYENM